MTVTTHTSPKTVATSQRSPSPPNYRSDKASALALRLAHVENALNTLTSGQVDAIVDPTGKIHLMRPAQDHLRQKERRLQAVIESIADVITVVDREGVILSQSHAVNRVLGYKSEELVGSSIFDRVHEEDLQGIRSAFFGVIELFRENTTAQFRHRARDGSWREIEATLSILRDGSSPSVVLSLRPITSLSRERTDPFWPPVPGIFEARKNRDIILSHGRQIPLTEFLLGIAELEEELRIDSAKMRIETLQRRQQLEARRTKEPLRLESIDAHEAARSVVQLCHPEAAAAGVEVLLCLRAEENHVQADWARLLQVMCNLVRSAVECCTPGSTISIASTNGLPGRFTFELAAHGIAIESALLPQIFDSFEPGALSPQQLHGGIRRSLNIARRLAEAQGGTLTASSEGPGKGATFHLTLNTATRALREETAAISR